MQQCLQQQAIGLADDRRHNAHADQGRRSTPRDTEESTTREGLIVVYSSRVRTLVDAVYDWARLSSLPRGFAWIARELAERRVTPAALVATTLRYGDLGTIRRMGALLEKRGVNAGLMRKLERALPESTGTIPWIPTKPKRGTLNRRWGLIMNGEI